MIQKLKDLFKFSAEHGLNLPTAYDHQQKGPSVSLLFAHISFFTAIISICILIHKDINLGTIAAITFAGLYFIFYMLRKLNKAKIDLDDRSIDLENSEEK